MLSRAEREKRWSNGHSYDQYIESELSSFRKQAWKDLLCAHFPEGAALDILDIGTGPGFFACILAEAGHRVTGIDSSEGMLACARKNSAALHVAPFFLKMDIDALAFPDDSFDVITARNVTWTLTEPERVYTELKRILRPGGRLLIYDANWHMHFFDPELLDRVRGRERRHYETYGRREVVCRDDMEYYAALPLSNTRRPAWDREVLERLGLDVSVREDIGDIVYEDWEKQLYGESPLFEVCAVKRPVSAGRQVVHDYWQERASTFGLTLEGDSFEEWKAVIAAHLPAGRLRVLDAGTGTGFIAMVMAALGHDVTAVDLCSNMVEKARENAARAGLSIRFLCTDAGELPFDDGVFDVVISRNVVWALPNPEEVLCQWRRVLRPGGLLMYFDGNHYYYLFSEQARRDREAYIALTGNAHRNDPGTVDYSVMDNAARALPLSRFDRPGEWDEPVLPRLGFSLTAVEVSRPQERLSAGAADGYYTSFLIAARKEDGGRS